MLAAMATAVFALGLFAGAPEDLTTLINKKVAVITEVLENKQLQKEEKNSRILGTIDGLFDFNLMAMLSLGPTEWRKLSGAQKREFAELFTKRVQESYLEKLHLYTDEKVAVEKAVQTKANRIQVPSFVLAKDGKTELLYKFYLKKSDWMIYDVEIAGVSIVQTYRAQFAEILKSGTFEKLMERLRGGEQLQP